MLHEKVQRWIWRKGWTTLRDAQEAAIPIVLEGKGDLIISAATAAGKTEAAFLPICSFLASDETPGVRALYIGPLKALINDQFERLEDLCQELAIPVHRWHGDVDGAKKTRVFEEPRGILLITPESLEGLFIRRGTELKRVFQSLAYVVVDELHAFINSERGRQLQSQLRRLELLVRRRIPRIGLSATLGDMELAKAHLRAEAPEDVAVIVSRSAGQELKMQLRGYLIGRSRSASEPSGQDVETEDSSDDVIAISRDLFRVLRGSSNLIFANSRSEVEQYSDLLRRMCDHEKVPNEFWPHHGSLSKSLREDLETRLKERSRPINAVCTSTLELGIDIGSVKSIAQIGPPWTVASLRQRLGRSGRRGGDPAILRLYVSEPEITPLTPLLDTLRLDLVQSIAMLNLLLRGWCEPPTDGALHLSTLVQQVLSLIAQFGGVSAAEAWAAICEHGPFRQVDRPMFARVLRTLGAADLITQMDDGTLLLGDKGERIVNHYSFYAAFESAEEYRVLHDGRLLGTLPLTGPLDERFFLIFAGRRWRVIAVDEEMRTILVQPAKGGRLPAFASAGSGNLHDAIRQEMFAIYTSTTVPIFLDNTAQALLLEGRKSFTRLGLNATNMVQDGQDSILFCWRGDRIVNTVSVLLAKRGLTVTRQGPALQLDRVSAADLVIHLRTLVSEAPYDAVEIAVGVSLKRQEKHDVWLDDELMSAEYAARSLDIAGAINCIAAVEAAT